MVYERKNKVQSPLEMRFLEDCATVGLLVEPQYQVGKIHADFAVVDKKIVIEIDGKEFHSSSEAQRNDKDRDDIYHKNGWVVIRMEGKFFFRHGEEIAETIKNIPEEELASFYNHHSSRSIKTYILEKSLKDINEEYLLSLHS